MMNKYNKRDFKKCKRCEVFMDYVPVFKWSKSSGASKFARFTKKIVGRRKAVCGSFTNNQCLYCAYEK